MTPFCPNCGSPNRDMSKYCSNCGANLQIQSSKENLSPETLLDKRYKIFSLIKSGGMGSVYKARDIRLRRDCAVKEMFGDAHNPEEQKYALKRFEEEAYMLANLRHPSLPTVVDYFIEGSRYYLVMDFVDGIDLEEKLKLDSRGISQRKVVKYSIEVLDVLEYLHSQSPPIIYRDIKPSNIIIRTSDDRAILIDFGIARTIHSESKTKKTIIGTPGYLSPEQWHGQPEARSDLYSLGVTMHHLLTGMEPHLFELGPVKNCLPDLERVIMKAVEKKVIDRYTSAREMKEALQNILTKPVERISIQDGLTGECYKCKKEFLLSDLIYKEGDNYCIECVNITSNNPGSACTIKMKNHVTQSIVYQKDNSQMILIPAGTFTMGSSGSSDEKPVHEVYLDEYYIDKYTVTNEQYKKFLTETGYISEGNWMKYYVPQKVNYPVVGVSWNDAKAYTVWSGKVLPTEAEWEKAAKGVEQREYPWGDEWDYNKCSSRKMDKAELIEIMIIMLSGRGTLPTGSFPEGASPYGIMDMAGNVNEWCSDWYDNKYYSVSPDKNPPGASSGSWKVIRGASWWDDDPKLFRCTARNGDHPSISKGIIGFRCVYKGVGLK